MRILNDQDALARMVARHAAAHRVESEAAVRRLTEAAPRFVDDAAGVAIATRVQARAAGSMAAAHNVQDGISLMQVADGALAMMTEYLDKVRVLALQSANGAYSDEQRASLQIGVDSLLAGFDQTWRSLEVGARTIQVGVDAGDALSLPTFDEQGHLRPRVTVSDAQSARSALDVLDEALERLHEHRAEVGAVENRLSRILSSLQAQQERGAAPTTWAADLGRDVTELLRSRTWTQAGTQMLAEVYRAGREAAQVLLQATIETPEPTPDRRAEPGRDPAGWRPDAAPTAATVDLSARTTAVAPLTSPAATRLPSSEPMPTSSVSEPVSQERRASTEATAADRTATV